MNSKIISGILIVVLVIGCVSEYNVMLPSSDREVLVVDGSIIEDTDVLFYISKSFPLNEDIILNDIFVNDAQLNIIGSDGYISPSAINQGRGAYQIAVGKLNDDVEYGLQIEYEGDTYRSALSKPLYTPEIDSISWIQPDSAGIVSFRVSTHDDAGAARFFSWSYTEDWEINTVYYTSIFFRPASETFYEDFSFPYFYCWRKNESSKLLLGSTESLRENRIINKLLYQRGLENDHFSLLYSVTVNQKVISKAAYEYYQNIIKLNEGMGGLFTPQPSELTGNITCITDPSKKVMGYVETAKNTTQKRIFVYPAQLTHPFIPSNCNSITNDSVRTFLQKNDLTYVYFYQRGYRPAGGADRTFYPQIVPIEWAPSTCTDCTARGGTKNKPDFWPNDHQ